jgi:hypothetical protein
MIPLDVALGCDKNHIVETHNKIPHNLRELTQRDQQQRIWSLFIQ